ncbi:MAG: c-type cytochrome [Massilia sp.]
MFPPRALAFAALFSLSALPFAARAQATGRLEQGQKLYAAKCAACHSVEYNGVGPAHKGVFGRKAGSASGYDYSPALRASTVVWNAATLERWLSNPEQFIPGQKMGFSVQSPSERAALIAFLQSISKP